MIKATELRIGNYITYQGEQITVEGVSVSGYLYHSKGQFDGSIGSAYVPFKPIPLTEEWLVKFGFEKTRDYNLSTKPKMYKIFKLSLRLMANEYTFCYENSFRKIEYVHQLQNLYFALTGEELILK